VKQAKEKQLRIRAKKVTEEKKAAFALQHAAKMQAKGRNAQAKGRRGKLCEVRG